MRLVYLLLLVLTACLPAPHDIVGRACDALHPCGESLQCVSNICVSPVLDARQPDLDQPEGSPQGGSPPGETSGDGGHDGGVSDAGDGGDGGTAGDAGTDGGPPPNLYLAGDMESMFEDLASFGDAFLVWEGSVARSPRRSLRLIFPADSTGGGVDTPTIDVSTSPATRYCARAYVSARGATTVTVALTIGRFGSPTPTLSPPVVGSSTKAPPPFGQWAAIETVFEVPPQSVAMWVRLEVSAITTTNLAEVLVDDVSLWAC